MRIPIRWLAIAALAATGLASPFWGPLLLRRIGWFEVRRVEVSGTRLLAPHVVLAASGIRQGSNVWDDPAAWEGALRGHPAVAEARVTRRFPATLRVRVLEKRPVAFVEHGALRPATASGELLPIDPARSAVDLPIVRGAWSDAAEQRAVRGLLGEMGRLTELDPGLLSEVSEVRAGAEGPGVLVLSHRLAEIVLPAGQDSGRLAQLRAVLGELQRRLPDSGGNGPAARVDLRFRDQIVVRLLSSV
jgi:cell division protein FtsQ